MKLLVTSDWHPDWVTDGVPRFDDVAMAVEQTVRVAIAQKVDAYFFLGDLCDPDSGSSVFRCVQLALSVALRLQEKDILSFWLAGNHDVIEDGSGDTTLTPFRSIIGKRVYLLEQPRRIEPAGSPTIVGLPYTASSHPYDAGAVAGRLVNAGENAIALGHLHLPGLIPGEETTDMPRGREVEFPTSLLKQRGALMLHGHYHRRQVTPDGVLIPGALARLTFGHVEDDPGFLLLEHG